MLFYDVLLPKFMNVILLLVYIGLVPNVTQSCYARKLQRNYISYRSFALLKSMIGFICYIFHCIKCKV